MIIDVERILKDLMIPYKISGKNARIKCLNPNHKEKDPSMFVELATGAYNCFGCHTTGHILGVLKEVHQLDDNGIQQYISNQNKGGDTEEQIHTFIREQMSRRTTPGTCDTVAKELSTLPIEFNYYLENQRGFTLEELHKWNIRVVNNPGQPYHNWIYIPIYYKGILRTWFIRHPFSTRKMYGYEKVFNNVTGNYEVRGYPRKDILFGLDSIPEDITEVYGFEGIFDKIWFERTRKHSIAFLGNRISKEQRQQLRQFKTLVLGLDNDNASMHLVQDALQLVGELEIRIWTPPSNKKDANLCTLEEMLEQMFLEVSILEFIQNERYVEWSLRK